MFDLNKVILSGRSGGDAEVKELESGSKVTRFSMATSESFQKDGEWQEKSQWHKISCFGKVAEYAADKIKKGSLVYLEGKVTYYQYQKDGETKYFTEIIATIIKVKNPKATTQASEPANVNSDDLPF